MSASTTSDPARRPSEPVQAAVTIDLFQAIVETEAWPDEHGFA